MNIGRAAVTKGRDEDELLVFAAYYMIALVDTCTHKACCNYRAGLG